MSIHELFNENNNGSTRSLQGTQELTAIATSVANRMLTAMGDDIENYRDRIKESASDNDVLDALIEEFKPFGELDGSSVAEYSEEMVSSMLKSQQSKRSRARGKTMTMDNYKTLLVAAVAEAILRQEHDLPKSTQGNKRAATVDYTPAMLEQFAADQEALRREIRNLQSKKSIYKSKAEFDETSDYWQSLLRAEVMLKDLRTDTIRVTAHVVEVDKTKDKLKELLNGIDPEHLKAADSKELLASIAQMVSTDGNTDEAE